MRSSRTRAELVAGFRRHLQSDAGASDGGISGSAAGFARLLLAPACDKSDVVEARALVRTRPVASCGVRRGRGRPGLKSCACQPGKSSLIIVEPKPLFAPTRKQNVIANPSAAAVGAWRWQGPHARRVPNETGERCARTG